MGEVKESRQVSPGEGVSSSRLPKEGARKRQGQLAARLRGCDCPPRTLQAAECRLPSGVLSASERVRVASQLIADAK